MFSGDPLLMAALGGIGAFTTQQARWGQLVTKHALNKKEDDIP